MNEIKSIERQLDNIKNKRKQNNIKTCYSNLVTLSNIMNDLNKYIFNDPLKEHKDRLKKICETERKTNIELIIHLSYDSFVENFNSEKDFKYLFLDIQKSSFYEEYKNDEQIKEMETIVKIFDLIDEAEKKKIIVMLLKNL